MTLDEDLTTRIERQRRLLLIMLQDTDNVEIALGDLSITNRLYRKIEPYCPHAAQRGAGAGHGGAADGLLSHGGFGWQ